MHRAAGDSDQGPISMSSSLVRRAHLTPAAAALLPARRGNKLEGGGGRELAAALTTGLRGLTALDIRRARLPRSRSGFLCGAEFRCLVSGFAGVWTCRCYVIFKPFPGHFEATCCHFRHYRPRVAGTSRAGPEPGLNGPGQPAPPGHRAMLRRGVKYAACWPGWLRLGLGTPYGLAAGRQHSDSAAARIRFGVMACYCRPCGPAAPSVHFGMIGRPGSFGIMRRFVT